MEPSSTQANTNKNKPTQATEADTNQAQTAQEDPTQALNDKIAQLEAQCNNLQDQYLRARADLDNARKRFVKDKEDVRVFTLQSVLNEVINIFDTLKMVLSNAEQNGVPEKTLQGFTLLLQQFQTSLNKFGISTIEPNNEAFNPHLHEAVSKCHHETIPEGHIVHLIRSGYSIGGKLLRPASVVVSEGPAAEAAKND